MADHNATSLGTYTTVPTDDNPQSDPARFSAANTGVGSRNRDIERNNGDGHDDDGEEAGFLPMDFDGEGNDGKTNNVDKSTLRKVLTMSVIFLFIVELGSYIMEPPLQQIMEDFVCHENFPDHKVGAWDEEDPQCSEAAVQGMLAMARSWTMWAKMFVPLFVQIPYGMMADKYGRRPVLFLALLGGVLSASWNFVVLSRPDTFSVWHLPLGYLATLIGGGDSVTIAVVWTIITDVVPAEARTNLFYKLHAMMLIMSAAMRPVAGWLMSKDPWLPMWIGLIALALSTISALLVPETLQYSQTSEKIPGDGVKPDTQRPTAAVLLSRLIRLVRVEALRIWHFIFSSKKVMLLVMTYGLSSTIFMAFEMQMLQYMTVRYEWDWSSATYYSIVSKVTSVVVLLGILPFASRAVEKRYDGNPVSRDLFLGLTSIAFIIAGNLLTVIAAVPALLVLALLVYGVGAGFWAQVRALLAETVDRNSLAAMSSVVAMVETLVSLVSIPFLGWLLSKGIEAGGFWIGLPYVMTSICATASGALLLAFKRLL